MSLEGKSLQNSCMVDAVCLCEHGEGLGSWICEGVGEVARSQRWWTSSFMYKGPDHKRVLCYATELAVIWRAVGNFDGN